MYFFYESQDTFCPTLTDLRGVRQRPLAILERISNLVIN